MLERYDNYPNIDITKKVFSPQHRGAVPKKYVRDPVSYKLDTPLMLKYPALKHSRMYKPNEVRRSLAIPVTALFQSMF